MNYAVISEWELGIQKLECLMCELESLARELGLPSYQLNIEKIIVKINSNGNSSERKTITDLVGSIT
jgi:predicted metalloenzyme YecM